MGPDLLVWIGALTAAGYDIREVDGYTLRDESGDNTNMPMPALVIHMRKGKLDFVINAYATNSQWWTVYGTAFTGKVCNRYFGFTVTGTREHAVADITALNAFLAK